MKFLSFTTPGGHDTWGAQTDNGIVDLGSAGLNIAESLAEAIVQDRLPRSISEGAPTIDESTIRYLPVIPKPGKILCAGVNYQTHQDETGRERMPAPIVFTRFADTQIGHRENARIPQETTSYDYEGEMAVIIGKPADHVSEEDAMDVIAGVSLYNDLSARDWQRHTGQWIPGKNFHGSGPFGPYFVPLDEIPDLEGQYLETRVNGEVRQRAQIKDMLFSTRELIAYISAFTPLSPGDVIVTGTPGGVGLFMDPPTFLAPGDVVEVSMAAVGTLSNTMTDDQAPQETPAALKEADLTLTK